MDNNENINGVIRKINEVTERLISTAERIYTTSTLSNVKETFVELQNSTFDHNEIINLYSNLTVSPPITIEQFQTFVSSLNDTHKIFILHKNNSLIAIGTLLVERKLIHGISNVGHIEDVVVSPKYGKQGYGKMMIEFLTNYAREANCYKVILNCSDSVKPFYEKCGYISKNCEMSKYF